MSELLPIDRGVEEHVRNIGERLARNHDVLVCTTDPTGTLPKKDVIRNVEIRRFKSWAPYEAYYFSRGLKKFLVGNSDNYQIMHAHSYHAFPALYAAQARNKTRLVFSPHYHGAGHTLLRSLLHKPYKFFGRSIFRKADMIVCVSNHEKDSIVSGFGVSRERVMVIPNGVDLKEFRSSGKMTKNYRIILCVGRLEKYKGVHHLIKVLPRLESDVVLEIVGKGPYKEALVRLAGKLHVVDRVRFLQDLPRNQLLQKYVESDLFALLSAHEAYGMAVAEALASGTACIVADTSALREWVDNKNCFGIDYPMDDGKLVKAINKAIGNVVTGVRLLDWDDTVQSLVGVYENA